MKFKLDNIKYVKILYKDAYDKPSIVKAAIKNISEKEILACAKPQGNINIELPQEITLSVICDDGLYRTKTTLYSVENDDPYLFFIIKTPEGMEYQQNREFFRVPVKNECTYCVNTDAGTVHIPAIINDLSANGVSIDVEASMLPQQDANIIFEINGKEIKTGIRFVRKEELNKGYRLSFFFTNISEADRNSISQYCIKKQLEQKRNSIY